MKLFYFLRLAPLGLAVLFIFSSSYAQDADKFYEGRELRMIVGTGPVGGFNTAGRLVARFITEYIPGKPTLIVQNMPGASGIKSANYLYAVAPKDGSVFATFNSAMPLYQMMEWNGIHFKAEEMSWIGSPAHVVSVVIVWHDVSVKSIEDARRTEVIMGASGAAGTTATYPAMLNNILGTRFKVITGYDNGPMMYAALERGEVQGVGGAYWSTYKSLRPDWIKEGKIVPILQMSLVKHSEYPELTDVPLLTDLAQNDEQLKIFKFIVSNSAYEYPFVAPPNIPKNRLEILRQAFNQAVDDPEFLSMAKSEKLEINLLKGEELQKIVGDIVATSPDIVEKSVNALKVKNSDIKMKATNSTADNGLE